MKTKMFMKIFLSAWISTILVGCTKGERLAKNVENTLLEMHNKLDQMQSELSEQKTINLVQEQAIAKQNEKITQLENMYLEMGNRHSRDPAIHLYVRHGCAGDIIPLSCTGEKTIFVTNAVFGEYANDCNSDCCTPHPDDCKESVKENNEADWIVLKLQCDNETQCDYLFQSSTFISNCSVSEIVDYMAIYYKCLPETTEPVVAFTAYTELTHQYEVGDVVVFDQTVTNIGGYYNSWNSIFICPRWGLYQFSVFVVALVNSTAQANIMLEGRQLVIAWADAVDETFPQSSNSVLVECLEGQHVWVESSSSSMDSKIFNNAWKHSTFSGVLLKAYE